MGRGNWGESISTTSRFVDYYFLLEAYMYVLLVSFLDHTAIDMGDGKGRTPPKVPNKKNA